MNEPSTGMTKELLLSEMPSITTEQADLFIKYFDMLVDWNTRMNLTRITEPREVAQKHFADSVLAADLIPVGSRAADIGTGAGFPGIPLKIIRPDIELTLIDSLGKRVNFLNAVCAELGFSAVTVHARAEDAARDSKLRGSFDFALSRAVAPMNILLELTVPFVKIGGSSLMYKASNVAEELTSAENALMVLGCRAELHEFSVAWGSRTIVSAVKLKPTDKKYPRKAGFVEKNPL